MSSAASAVTLAAFDATPWRRHLVALGTTTAIVLLLFARDVAQMAIIWWTSSTFNHCLLILPILGWLVWQRAPAIANLVPATWPVGLLLVGAGAASWLLGDAAGVSLLRHAGLIVILQGCVATLLGRDISRALLFPLTYALFLIPVGEELVPVLQGVTAKISMFLLSIVGIPAYMEGVFITTPGGYFEVAEACSGVKFLVAMFALGVLVAALCFRTWPRRIAFIVAALVVPIFANGVRAFATIYVAGRTSAAAAGDFDHIVYGWFFFAIIIAALLGTAWRFFDRPVDEEVVVRRSVQSPGPKLPLAIGLCLGLAAVPILWSAAGSASARSLDFPAASLPRVAGWTRVEPAGQPAWTPRFAGADRLLLGRYRNNAGDAVDLVIAVYAWQAEGRELVGYGQGAVSPEGGWSWSEAARPPVGGRADRIVSQGVTREVLTFYRVGRVTSGDAVEVKLATLKARLLGGRQTGVAVLMSSIPGDDAPRATLDGFARALGSVEALAARQGGA